MLVFTSQAFALVSIKYPFDFYFTQRVLMKILSKLIVGLFASTLLLGLSACSDSREQPASNNVAIESSSTEKVMLDVYKSPTCGCCKDWVAHVEGAGFAALIHHPSDLGGIKQQYGISSSYQSCHTAVSDQGYVFEGHVPADVMQRFLDNPPESALGLAVAGMPFGSPGMEMGDRYDDYAVMLIRKDGSSEIYQEIKGK